MYRIAAFFAVFFLCISLQANAQTTAANDSISLPNVFTPNYDGINDVFKPVISYEQVVEGYEMYVFDRYGLKIFESVKINQSWDGRTSGGEPCTDGFYYCVVKCTVGSEKKEYKGAVFLVR